MLLIGCMASVVTGKKGDAIRYIFAILISMVGMWYLLTSSVSTMEFLSGDTWIGSYRFSQFGEYCDERDYFTFDKWGEYSMGVKFLIISWLIF